MTGAGFCAGVRGESKRIKARAEASKAKRRTGPGNEDMRDLRGSQSSPRNRAWIICRERTKIFPFRRECQERFGCLVRGGGFLDALEKAYVSYCTLSLPCNGESWLLGLSPSMAL